MVTITTKSVSQPDSAALRSATGSASAGVAHVFSAFSCRSMRRWPLRPLPLLRCAALTRRCCGIASARTVVSMDRASRAVRRE
jgi:hypothetical protein